MSFMPGANLWRRLRNIFVKSGTDLHAILPSTGKLKVQRLGGADTSFLYYNDSNVATHIGPSLFVRDATDTGRGGFFSNYVDASLYILCGNKARLGDDSQVFNPGVVVASDAGMTFASGDVTNDNNTSDAGFLRLAASVVKASAGMSGDGWLQQPAGHKRVTSDVTVDSTTPGNVTDLTVTLIAGRKYAGRLVAFTNTPTAADGLRIDFDGGAGTMTSFRAMGTVADTVSVRPLAMTTAIATDFVDTTTTGDAMTVIEFAMVVNAGGTFIPRIGKEADAGDAITLYTNSYMQLWDSPN